MRRKTPGLSSALESFMEKEPPAATTPRQVMGENTPEGHHRRGQTLQLLLPRACAQAMRLELKYLALERQTTQSDLMLEALRDLLLKYGKRPPPC